MHFSPAPLHIPDGFLTLVISLIFWALTALAVGMAISKTNKSLGEKQIPLMGVMAAFIFAAQMLNFPVAGGTSGHFMGGVLAAILLGPWTGLIVMSLVLMVQCIIFQDGGLTALGANIFNMGIIGSSFGFYLYGMFRLLIWGNRTRPVAYALASWFSIMLAAFFCSLELAFSGTVPLMVALPAMLSTHLVIGIGEAVITTTALMMIWKMRPEFFTLVRY